MEDAMRNEVKIPKEFFDVLNIEFMGFKMWHFLLVALLVPSPVFLVCFILLTPGLKDKVIGLIRNGITRLSADSATDRGEGSKDSAEGDEED